MNRSLNGSYQNTRNSQEPAVVKEEITYESALRDVGIDEVFVARKLKDLLQGKDGDGILRREPGKNLKITAPSSPLLERLPRFFTFTQRTQKTLIGQSESTLVQSHIVGSE